MVLASELSVRLGLMPAAFAERMRRLCTRARLPVRAPALGADRYLELMRVDKKSEDGKIRFIVIEELGRAALQPVPDALVRETLAVHGGR
jgi:3-dehydroquinate synthase